MTSIPVHETQPAPPQPGINPWLVRLPVLVVLGGMLLGITLVVLFAGYQIGVMGRILPGTSAYGVALGGMSVEQAAATLEEAFAYDDETVFTFRHGDQFWQHTAGELGVSLDADATAQQAYNAGLGETPTEAVGKQMAAWFSGVNVQPVVRYDEAQARAALEQIAAEIGQPPQNAALVLDGLQVQTTPPQSGTVLDIDAALAEVSARVADLQPGGEIPLTVTETTPKVTNVEATAAYIRAAISAPLLLVANDAENNMLGPWRVAPEQIAAALDVQFDPQRAEYTVDVDLSSFAPQLESLAPGLIIPPRDGRFVFNEATGELETLEPAVNGRELDVAATIARMEEAVFNPQNRTVEMAFGYQQPRYHNEITAAELGITELVSSSRTLFTGSTAARRHNIEHAAAMYNGVIVAPGEIFSFNEIIGDITEEQGFKEGAIIFGGRTVKGVGGGVCQVSTTVYRAAFFGGFPIVERYSHGYRVYYYELNSGPGLDAAIFTPDADFKFENDTDYHLLIETEFLPEQDALEYRFYSTNPGRTVEISEPIVRNEVPPTKTIYEANENLQPGQELQVDWSQTGGDVIVTRVIKDAQGNTLERRDYGTYYQPWSAVIQVPPGDPRLSQNS